MTEEISAGSRPAAARAMILPLALAQFIASYAATNMNVARQDFSIGGVVIIPKGWISPVWLFIAIGALFLVWFFLLTRARRRRARTCCSGCGCSATGYPT